MTAEKERKWKQNMEEDKKMEWQQKEEMQLVIEAKSENESLARICVAAFLTRLHPTMEELEDVRTAVSEAVTNAIVHGMPEDNKVYITCAYRENIFHVEIEDRGVGIEDVEKAMEPLFTTRPQEERAGMGFAFMEAFMDELHVLSGAGCGTKVIMEKVIGYALCEG